EARDANDNQWEKISAIETGAIERDAERSKVCSNHRIKQAAKSVGLGGLSGAGMIGILELLKVYFQGHWVG
ncbi:MAG: hypothetical protein KAR06_04100, partial [Deltaproteobacteria bacterium]|nr:hypothetical protein [Deltaproteobacteria bacterium]